MRSNRGREPLPDTETVVFNGVRYNRRPGRKYYKTNRWDKERKRYYAESLHQAVWKFHRGPIPQGHDVHHIDGDYNRNVIDNLELLTRSEHARRHRTFAKYSQSAKGRAEQSKRIKKLWAAVEFRSCVCTACGGEFQTRWLRNPKYCSQRCCAREGYRRRHPGVRHRS